MMSIEPHEVKARVLDITKEPLEPSPLGEACSEERNPDLDPNSDAFSRKMLSS